MPHASPTAPIEITTVPKASTSSGSISIFTLPEEQNKLGHQMRKDRTDQPGDYHRAAAASSLSRASTQRPSPATTSRFQNGASVFSRSIR